jgi:hypothetical protein
MRNLARARAKWARSMRRFLVGDAADPKTRMATFYMTVVLYVLLYGSESWVLTGDLMRQLRSFHRRSCCRGLTGEFIRQDEKGEWICPKSEEVLKKAGVLTIEEHVHSEEARVDHEIRADEEYIWEVQKLPKDS